MLDRDNGPEFISQSLNELAGVKLGIHYMPLGQPWCNGFVESFNSRICDDCLNMNSFEHIGVARTIITDWKEGCGEYHRHSHPGYLTSKECAQN